MDTLSLRFGIVQRSAGGDARKMAAYQMCGHLAADGRKLDFSRKAAEHCGRIMLTPPNAPPWAQDPQRLWDHAEAAERRGDAQSARLLEFSIPRDVPAADRLDFVRHVLAPFADQGMGVQADIHSKAASDGAEHPHAHAMLTLRGFDGDGFAATKTRQWNVEFREGQGRAVRERIAASMNGWFAAHRIAARVDHRSFADRGIEGAPEQNAPRRAWKAHAADPSSPAAEHVRALLADRATRAGLAAAEIAEAAAGTEIARLLRQLTTTRETAMPTPSPGSGRRPQADRPRPQPWMRRMGGLDALSPTMQASARESYRRWTQGRPEVAMSHPVNDYVSYVQSRQHRAGADDHAETVLDSSADADTVAHSGPDGIAPSSDAAGETRRRAHLESLLAGHYSAPSALALYVRRVTLDPASRTATLHLRAGGWLVDHGDRIAHQGRMTQEAAMAMAAAAAAHGWPKTHLTGSLTFKEMVATAMALHEPPVLCDHCLSKHGQEQVADELRKRAGARVSPLDGAAVQIARATSPTNAAAMVLDHAEAQARAGLAGKPTGSADAAGISRPRVAETITRRDTALADARDAIQAAAAHRAAHPWAARILDGAARRRQAGMDAEAIRADQEARMLAKGHDSAVRRLERTARVEAKANGIAQEDWRWSKPVRNAEVQLARIASVRTAIDGGNMAALAATADGDVLTAAAAGERQRQAEREAGARTQRAKAETARTVAGRAAAATQAEARQCIQEARVAQAAACSAIGLSQAAASAPRRW